MVIPHVVQSNHNGFTLVEALIAILVLSVMLLGLVPAFLKAYNLQNETALREVAMDIAHERLEMLRSMDIDDISSNSTSVTRQINKNDVTYTVNSTVTSLFSGDLKQVTVRVYWNYRNQQKSYNATTTIGAIDE